MYAEKYIVPREGLADDLVKRQQAIKMLLETIPGEDAEREGLLETPKRVANMYEEIVGGYEMNPAEILSKTFDAGNMHDDEYDPVDVYANGIVIVKDIPFYSHCEHHMVPFFGHAHVAYIPKENGEVVGLSKICRLVECFARRLQIQERLTTQIADCINEELNPLGVMVVIQAEHLCMSMRGVKKPGSNTGTSVGRGGVMDNSNNARAEFMSMLELNK